MVASSSSCTRKMMAYLSTTQLVGLDIGSCPYRASVSLAVSFLNDGDGVTKDYSLSHCQVYDSVARAWTMDKELDFGLEALNFVHPVHGETVFWVTKVAMYIVAFDMKTMST
ncbi:unnamed protein product [Musa textilis]